MAPPSGLLRTLSGSLDREWPNRGRYGSSTSCDALPITLEVVRFSTGMNSPKARSCGRHLDKPEGRDSHAALHSPFMRHGDHYWGLVLQTHLLRASMTLHAARMRHLDQTRQRLGYSQVPSNPADFNQFLMETAKDLGIRTSMILDLPREIEQHHYGPLQVALALFDGMIVRYRELSRADSVYQDAAIDRFCRRQTTFLRDLKSMRHAVLHQRPENRSRQLNFVGKYAQHMSNLLAEGISIYEDYVRRLRRVLRKGGADA